MIQAHFDSKELENKLKVFASGLGGIFYELLAAVGDKMTADAKTLAPVRTGKMKDNIKFIVDSKENQSAFTTRKNLTKGNIWYSNIVEHGANIQAKRKDYLIFKVNGEWKKVKSVRVSPKPFMKPVWNDYFGGDSGKGYKELAEALQRKMAEDL